MNVQLAELRAELRIIAEWIKPGTRVLDLGCGDGELLAYLQTYQNVTGYGVEIDQHHIVAAINNNVSVLQGDIDRGLNMFDDDSFDYVVMSQTIQALYSPDKIIKEMLRVGREAIITFPNFGQWRSRLQIMLGNMPMTPTLPNTWFDTPNIHMCTIGDFENFCHSRGLHVLERSIVDREHRARVVNRFLPNLLGEVALYRIRNR